MEVPAETHWHCQHQTQASRHEQSMREHNKRHLYGQPCQGSVLYCNLSGVHIHVHAAQSQQLEPGWISYSCVIPPYRDRDARDTTRDDTTLSDTQCVRPVDLRICSDGGVTERSRGLLHGCWSFNVCFLSLDPSGPGPCNLCQRTMWPLYPEP